MRMCLFVFTTALAASRLCGAEEIACPGVYGGHLQGIAPDAEPPCRLHISHSTSPA